MSVLALASATICFSQLSSKLQISWLNQWALKSAKIDENCSGTLCLPYEYCVKKLEQFIDQKKSYVRVKFRKNEVFVSN